MYCVYIHINKINQKVYIGITNDINRRWRCGGVEYKESKRFYNAIKKYGFDSFEHKILESNLSQKDAYEREIYYIDKYNSTDKNKGYNISKGGNGGKIYSEHPRNMLGKHQTEKQKETLSKIMRDRQNNPMKNGKVVWGITHEHPKGMEGKKHSNISKESISKTLKEKQINCKEITVTYKNGVSETFKSVKNASEKLGLSQPVVSKLIRTGKPYEIRIKNQYTEHLLHLEGMILNKTIPR